MKVSGTHRNSIVDGAYHRILRLLPTGYWSRFQLRVLGTFRRAYLRFDDPLIETAVAGVNLLVPFSHDLPLVMKLFPDFGWNLARICAAVREKYRDLTLIDIGANIGDTVAIVRSEAAVPILCIEGDEVFYAILEKNLQRFRDVVPVCAFIGFGSPAVAAAVKRESGTARIVPSRDDETTIRTIALSEVLATHPRFAASKMIKIDTDGFDGIIIRASYDVLSKNRPVLFFEYHPFLLAKQEDDGISLFATLRETGYGGILIYDRTGEFMFSTFLSDSRFVEELHAYFADPAGIRHCDICAFHTEDIDLFESIRKNEIARSGRAHGAA